MLFFTDWLTFSPRYNIFIHYNEDLTCCHKLLSPLVLLAYPFWIAPVTILVGFWAGTIGQISWQWESWTEAVRSPDSGFMGWACTQLNLPDCSPYQVVVIEGGGGGGLGDGEYLVKTPQKMLDSSLQSRNVRPTPIWSCKQSPALLGLHEHMITKWGRKKIGDREYLRLEKIW